MTFSDLDAAELTLGKPVTSMTDSELVSYLKLAVRHHQDIDIPVDGNPERAVMAALKRTYGPDAGNIVKWCCWHHGAKMGQGKMAGQVVGYFSFAKGMKWFTDMLYVELQQHLKAEVTRVVADRKASAGFARLEDF